MSTIPFSYHLYHHPTKKHYYGIKFAKGCNPADLWVTYFSTSKLVKQLIAEYGADSFTATVRKVFTSPEEALRWEHKVLRRLNASASTNWLNRHNGGIKFRSPLAHSDEAKRKMSKKVKGIPKTADHRKHMSQSGKKYWNTSGASGSQRMKTAQLASEKWRAENHELFYSEERNKKMAASKKGCVRQYLPDGSFIMVKPSH